MNSVDTKAKRIPTLKINPFTPVKRIVDQVGQGFEELGDVLQVTGLPVKVFCFRNQEHVAALLRHQPVGMTKYPQILPRVKKVMGNGGYILAGGSEWKERRTKVQPAFKAPCLRHYAQQIPAVTRHLINRWDERIEREGVFDICRDLQALITQINFDIFFSKDLSGGKCDLSDPLLEEVRSKTQFIELEFVRPTPLWVPQPKHFRFRQYDARLREIMREIIRERRNAKTEDKDLLSVLLDVRGEESGKPWTDEDILDEVFSVYYGAAVMSTTLAWCFYMIASHPEVQRKLREELKDVLAGREPRVEDLASLKYTEMVMNETVRLYPPSWGYPRYCEQGMEIDGYSIPKNSLVVPMVYHSHRDPRYWERPDDFYPEHFDSEKTASIDRFLYYPYGGGARMCLGANLAPLVLQLVIASVFQKYRMEFKPRFDGDPVEEFGFEIHPHDQICMDVRRLDDE